MSNSDKYELAVVVYLSQMNQGIGARRWDLMTKAFRSQNVKVLTITSDFKADLLEENTDRIVFQSKYPKILDDRPLSFKSKIEYRLALFKRKMLVDGFPYDKSILDFVSIKQALNQAIEKGVRKFIVSGAPFDLCHQSLLYLEKKNVEVIIDFRDPWTWSDHFMSLSRRRYEVELKKERFVVEKADKIIVPSARMKKFLSNKYLEFESKFEVLEHGFDPHKIASISVKRQTKPIRLIYAGTLYSGVEDHYLKIAETIEKENGRILFDLYTNNALDKNFLNYKFTSVHLPLSENEYLALLKSSTYFLSIVPSRFKDYVSSKYYEIFASNLKIILVSEKGDLSHFVESNRFGKRFDFDSINQVMGEIYAVNNESDKEQISLERYAFPELARRVIQMFGS